MAIDPLPIPPRRDDAGNFAARADAFLGALPNFRAQANALAEDVEDQAAIAAAAAATAINAPGTSATSTTSNDLTIALHTFTIQTGKAFAVGQTVVCAQTAAPTNWMQGVITAHDSGTGALTVSVNLVSGTGTGITGWTISLAAPVIFASADDVRAGNVEGKVVTVAASMAALAAVTIDPADWSMAEAINYRLSPLTANKAIANPKGGIIEGKTGRITVLQDATGGRSITWGTYFQFADGVQINAGTGPNERTIFYYDVLSATEILITAVRNVKR